MYVALVGNHYYRPALAIFMKRLNLIKITKAQKQKVYIHLTNWHLTGVIILVFIKNRPHTYNLKRLKTDSSLADVDMSLYGSADKLE